MDDEMIGKLILDCGFRVHTALGPGLLESAYETCLIHELKKVGIQVNSQVLLPVCYDGMKIDAGYRIDMIVGGSVVVELKAVEKMVPLHYAQILSYLKLGKFRPGYLLNFNVSSFKDGIKRLVN